MRERVLEKFVPTGYKVEVIPFESPTDGKNAVVTKSVDVGTFGIAAAICIVAGVAVHTPALAQEAAADAAKPVTDASKANEDDIAKETENPIGNLTILPWIFGMCVVLLGGWISQRLKKAGVSSRRCRGTLAAATVTLGGCILPFVGSMPTPELKLACLVFGSAIGSTIYVVLPMIVSELTPQPQRAAMLAITTSFVTLAGVLAPLIMGSLIQDSATPNGGYEKGYVILGVLLLAGGIIGLLFIRPEADRKRLATHAVVQPGLATA